MKSALGDNSFDNPRFFPASAHPRIRQALSVTLSLGLFAAGLPARALAAGTPGEKSTQPGNLSVPAGHAAEGGLRRALSPEDFSRAGLDKLSAEELAHLEKLVAARGVVAGSSNPANSDSPETLRGEAAFGKDAEVAAVANVMLEVPDEIRTRIVGPFNGWKGKTTFTLENGQIWRQSEGGSFHLSTDSPAVTIKRGSLGTYFLRIDGYNSRTKVVRVK